MVEKSFSIHLKLVNNYIFEKIEFFFLVFLSFSLYKVLDRKKILINVIVWMFSPFHEKLFFFEK